MNESVKNGNLTAILSPLKKELVGREGFEPSTNGLKVRCSTDWANDPTIWLKEGFNKLRSVLNGARGQTWTGTPRKARDFKSLVSTDSTTRAEWFTNCARWLWRRVPESNRATWICNPVHNRFANTPLVWSGKRGSNSRPRPWQGRALPTELFPHSHQMNETALYEYF